jgi:hypothetical protein
LFETSTGGERAVLDLFAGASVDGGRSSLRRALLMDQLVLSLAFPPDGKRLAIGSGTTVYLWDVAQRKEIRQMGGGHVFARGLAFSPDGRTLAAGWFEGGIRLWNVETGVVLCDLKAHDEAVTGLTFSADGRRLASASLDTTVLLWDVAQVLRDNSAVDAVLSAAEADARWKDLASPDAQKAFRAVGDLVQYPAQAVALARDRLRPVKGVEAERLQKLVDDLSESRYAVREKAARELEQLAELAVPALKKLLAGNPLPEARQRAETLLAKLESGTVSPGVLTVQRAIEILEHIGSPEARQVLEGLANGAAGHRLTEDARAALARLRR